jgi:multiple sugar transport system permease protein
MAKQPKTNRESRAARRKVATPGRLLLHAIALFGTAVILLPVYWMTMTSFKRPNEIISFPMTWVPNELFFGNYTRLFDAVAFHVYFFNSFLVAGSVALCNIILCSMAGYALARFAFPGRDLIFVTILVTMMIPIQLLFIPLFLVVKYLGLVNSYAALILPAAMNPMMVFLMRQTMLGMPGELVDAARIDGAGEFRIFARIVMPLMVPALAALGIVSFTWSWNAFLWPLIVVKDQSLFTLPLGLAALMGLYSTEYGPLMAGMVIAVGPILLCFAFLQRFFMKGLTFTGMKG